MATGIDGAAACTSTEASRLGGTPTSRVAWQAGESGPTGPGRKFRPFFMTPHQLHLKREGRRRYRLKNPDKVREEKRLYRRRHPDVILAAKKRYRLRHPEEIRRSQRKHSLRWKYGLTLADYDRLAAAGCAICGTHPDPDDPDVRIRVLHADHDHITGQFRGLLCRGCNFGLGFLKDDPTLLRRARQYLMDA